MKFAKGHGTENDFVILDGVEDLSAEQVSALCDRRAGIGADGVLNVVRRDDQWFMDYRNADGSLAEMCGNGVRVFAHWVALNHDAGREFVVGTRAGDRRVKVHELDEHDASVSVDMGRAEVMGLSTAHLGDTRIAGLGVNVGNPHLAAVIPGLTPQELADFELSKPEIDPEFFPDGVNLEVLTALNDGEVHMRVFERGVGETRSCGTGTVAATVAALADAGRGEGSVRVHVPGGTVQVSLSDKGAVLTGPSKLIARGQYL